MGGSEAQVHGLAVDAGRVFAQLPTAYLVMDRDLVIVEANDAYLRVLGRCREELLGRPVFEAFPPAPGSLDEHGRNPLALSFARARDTGCVDRMPLLGYDVVDGATGRLEQRWWSLISAPVLDAHGETTLVLQRVEDVTEYVVERRDREVERARGEQWRKRAELVEADLFARASELRAALAAEALASRRLAGLAEAALAVAAATTVEQLVDLVMAAGLTALGADGGAVAVRDEERAVVAVTASEALGAQARSRYRVMPLDERLPSAWSARTGEPVLLPDREAGLAWSPLMAGVHATTGRLAWATLPLRVGDRLLGSLSASWTEAHVVDPDELALLEALAAQCAQALDRLQVRVAEQRAAAASRRLSEALQRSLLPEPTGPEGLEVAVRYRPASAEAQIGGDWYDAFLTRRGEAVLVVGDVTGHDSDAAVVMAQVRNVLRGVALNVPGLPGAVLGALDRTLRDLQVDGLATAVLAQVCPDPDRAGGHLLHWSTAGHPPPLLLTGGTATPLASAPDLLLGLEPGGSRTDQSLPLPAGATVLLFTDGLVERRGEDLDVGLERLRHAAQQLAALPLEALCDALLDRLAADPEDDVALLALRLPVG